MILMRVTAVDYFVEEQNHRELPMVQLAGRDENGERRIVHVTGATPWFYARKSQAGRFRRMDDVRSVEYGYESYDGVQLCRVDVRVPGNCGSRSSDKDLTQMDHETWQSDIPFYRKCSIEDGLSGYIRIPDESEVHISDIETDIDSSTVDPIEPRVFIADIEVVSRGNASFEELVEDCAAPITHITVWDSKEDEYVCIYLDEERIVNGAAVKDCLEAETADVEEFDELAKDIHLRRVKSESDLLKAFCSMVEERQPDIVSGWNFVSFDWDYLLNRYSEYDDYEQDDYVNKHRLSDIGWVNGYQTERKVDCLPAFDMLRSYKKMTIPFDGRMRSYSLDYIAKEELGFGKIPNINVRKAYQQSRSRLTAYNIVDVMLCVAIERKMEMHDFYYNLAELSSVQIYDAFSEMRLVDGYIMSRSDDDEILPAAEESDISENAGGLVLEPGSGVQDWVGVIDLKSLYPSCIITWNLSPETIHWYEDKEPHGEHIDIPILPDADHAEGGNFDESEIDFSVMWADISKQGILPKYLKLMFPEREQMKAERDRYDPDDPRYRIYDQKQTALKVIMNSAYGVSSMNYWRLATEGLGDSVTSTARYALWQGKEIAQYTGGHDIVYGDTDSVLVSVADEDETMDQAVSRGKALAGVVNQEISKCVKKSGLRRPHPLLEGDLHGTDRHCLVYEFEKLYRRFFQAGTKKRYAGNIVWKEGKEVDDMDNVGFESQRSDSMEITSEVQPEVISRILDGDDFAEVSKYIQSIIAGVESGKREQYEIALPKSLGQPLIEYGNTQTARACRFSNNYLETEWRQNDDPWLYFVEKTPAPVAETDVIALGWDEDIPEGYTIDYDRTYERGLEGPLQPILDEMNWKFAELKQGKQTQSAAGGDWDAYEPEEDEEDEWGW